MNPIGIYEKALPTKFNWHERLTIAKNLGFDFVEMSVDETDERLSRLEWSKAERENFVQLLFETGMKVPTMCLSGHRRFPLGSHDQDTRNKALEIMKKAIDLASDIGIRVIQLAGYDVYYEEKDELTRKYFIENLKQSLQWAGAKQVILAIEIMDDPFMNSITKYLSISAEVSSPWLYVYPDLGNLSAWGNDTLKELTRGKLDIAAIHLKDTLAVTDDFAGKFKGVDFGAGCVDFQSNLTLLQSLSYSGPFLIEMWNETNNEYEKEIKKALSYLLPILKEAGFDYEDKFARVEKSCI
ncbi:L-ribulose-5-phosphate 3-epimerase [Bacillus sp. FJAT-50079]|uniref:L-ribulose-5-phosphate 3-epimerase n=1 Tax=Bacillus sp. FJAT-50079 TaxID=2833577 RepID=UPI001BC93383|nr:L-ribulose-5-phosphate 3-epimerase [Bacillus sp. FJAT-50079]MBS4210177.1 L-ribulose-5-phosphate 3-epimerase [Bacillus sp. FJAT-50079]